MEHLDEELDDFEKAENEDWEFRDEEEEPWTREPTPPVGDDE